MEIESELLAFQDTVLAISRDHSDRLGDIAGGYLADTTDGHYSGISDSILRANAAVHKVCAHTADAVERTTTAIAETFTSAAAGNQRLSFGLLAAHTAHQRRRNVATELNSLDLTPLERFGIFTTLTPAALARMQEIRKHSNGGHGTLLHVARFMLGSHPTLTEAVDIHNDQKTHQDLLGRSDTLHNAHSYLIDWTSGSGIGTATNSRRDALQIAIDSRTLLMIRTALVASADKPTTRAEIELKRARSQLMRFGSTSFIRKTSPPLAIAEIEVAEKQLAEQDLVQSKLLAALAPFCTPNSMPSEQIELPPYQQQLHAAGLIADDDCILYLQSRAQMPRPETTDKWGEIGTVPAIETFVTNQPGESLTGQYLPMTRWVRIGWLVPLGVDYALRPVGNAYYANSTTGELFFVSGTYSSDNRWVHTRCKTGDSADYRYITNVLASATPPVSV